jgi:deoxyribose-phosphate aldolase
MKDSPRAELAGRIEQYLLRPDATGKEVEHLCAEAREYRFRSVCLPTSRVELACARLEDTDIKITALVAFPFGAAEADAKRYETELAIDCGAQEIEMAINVGRIKDGDRKYVLRELRDVAEAADERPVKVAIETALLTREETLLCCELALDSGVQYIAAGTDLTRAPSGELVQLLSRAVGEKFGVKAIGEVRDAATARALINFGAATLGTLHGAALLKT